MRFAFLEETEIDLNGKKIKGWQVERVNTQKRMLCPETALVNAEDYLDQDDLVKYGFYS